MVLHCLEFGRTLSGSDPNKVNNCGRLLLKLFAVADVNVHLAQ